MNADLNRVAADLGLMAARAESDAKEVTEEFTRKIADNMRSTVKVDTGATRDSVSYEVTVKSGMVTGEAGASTRQARFLESGTATQPPQPFAGPSLEEQEEPYVKAIADRTTSRW
jgi:HK97 gp10 family phage protein